jgi:hypothetical protein
LATHGVSLSLGVFYPFFSFFRAWNLFCDAKLEFILLLAPFPLAVSLTCLLWLDLLGEMRGNKMRSKIKSRKRSFPDVDWSGIVVKPLKYKARTMHKGLTE